MHARYQPTLVASLGPEGEAGINAEKKLQRDEHRAMWGEDVPEFG